MQEGILMARPESKYVHVLKSRPAVKIWHLFDTYTVKKWTDAAEFPGVYYIRIIRLDAALCKLNVYVKSLRVEQLQRTDINGIH